MGLQKSVSLGKWPAAQERRDTRPTLGSSQRAWVAAADTAFVLRPGKDLEPGGEGPCVAAPEEEHDGLREPGAGLANIQDKFLPAPSRVAGGLTPLHGQRGVEQQHAPLGPGRQVAVRRDGTANVVVKFLEDVAQGRRNSYPGVDREGQAIGLPGTVIGVLPNDDDLDSVGRRQSQGIENLVLGRIDGMPGRRLSFGLEIQ